MTPQERAEMIFKHMDEVHLVTARIHDYPTVKNLLINALAAALRDQAAETWRAAAQEVDAAFDTLAQPKDDSIAAYWRGARKGIALRLEAKAAEAERGKG